MMAEEVAKATVEVAIPKQSVVEGEPHLGRLKKIDDELWLTNSHGGFLFNDCVVVARVIEVIRRV